MQTVVDGLLPDKLVHPVIRIIIAYKKCFPDVLRDGGETRFRCAVVIFRRLPGIVTVDLQRSVFRDTL